MMGKIVSAQPRLELFDIGSRNTNQYIGLLKLYVTSFMAPLNVDFIYHAPFF